MTSVSKNVYIDILDDTVNNKYNNTYQSTIKMKPVDVKSNTYMNSSKKINDKNPKLVILLEHENIKTFCERLRSKLV